MLVGGGYCSPFGGIPRNWKHDFLCTVFRCNALVPPSGGSLEIGNLWISPHVDVDARLVPPSGGSLEIGNFYGTPKMEGSIDSSPFGGIPRNWKPQNLPPPSPSSSVPPSGGSLEIGNSRCIDRTNLLSSSLCSPFGGIPRNWKQAD